MTAKAEIANCKRKATYPNEESARKAAHRQMKFDFTNRALRPYKCFWCKKWHLTSEAEPKFS